MADKTAMKIVIDGHEIHYSENDHDLLRGYKWHVYSFAKRGGRQKKYVCSSVDGETVYMHRLVMNAPSGFEVDHINGDGLNNTRENLRVATRAQNTANKPSYSGTSKFKGVCRAATKEPRWRAWCMVNKKSIYLGSFKTEAEAARAYNLAAEKAWGEFAHLNAA